MQRQRWEHPSALTLALATPPPPTPPPSATLPPLAGEAKMAQKMLGAYHTAQASFEMHASKPRPSREALPGKIGYGCTVPRHRTIYKNDFQTTSRNDFTGQTPDPAFPDGMGTAAIPIYAP